MIARPCLEKPRTLELTFNESRLDSRSATEAGKSVQGSLARLLVRAAVHAAHVARVVKVWLPDAAIVPAMPALHVHHACLLAILTTISQVKSFTHYSQPYDQRIGSQCRTGQPLHQAEQLLTSAAMEENTHDSQSNQCSELAFSQPSGLS